MINFRKPEGKRLEIKVNNETLEQVESFKYLGTQIKEDGRTDTEVQNRIIIAKNLVPCQSC